MSVKVSLAQCVQLHRTFLQCQPLLMGILRNLRGHVIANDRVEAGHQHQALLHDGGDPLLIRLDALNKVPLEAAHTISQKSRAVQEIPDHDGLDDVELEISLRTSKSSSCVVSEHLAADHGKSFALCRVDLARHNR